MDATKSAINIRNDFAKDILKLRDALLGSFDATAINIDALNVAATSLKNIKRIHKARNEETTKPSNWGYSASKIHFKLNEGVPGKTSPKEIEDLILFLDINVVGDCDVVGTLDDPFKELALEIKIEGDILEGENIKKIITCYHLDRHIVKKGDNSNEPHPIYHFQFGGKNLVNTENELNTGDLIVLETPRISHHPMELILGIDFVLSHFFPKKLKEIIRKDRHYAPLISKYQSNILKPYYHTISNKWNFNSSEVVSGNPLWSPLSICPQII